MNFDRKKVLLALAWMVFGFAFWQTHGYFNSLKIPPTYEANNLTAEQLVVQEDIIAEKDSRLAIVSRLPGEKTIYLYPDGNFSTKLPDWYDSETIALNEAEKLRIAKARLVDTPAILFWPDGQLTLDEHNELVSVLKKALECGLMIGLMMGLMIEVIGLGSLGLPDGPGFGVVAGLLFGLGFGVVVGLLIWFKRPVFGLGFGLVAGLGYGLTFYSIYPLAYITAKSWLALHSDSDEEISVSS